nr:hypothetical protein [Candidatus Sigynarchaeota archaeon]
MATTNDTKEAPLTPQHKKMFTLAWILTFLYAWIPSLTSLSPPFGFSLVSRSSGLYILAIAAFVAMSVAFFKIDPARFPSLVMLVYVLNYALGAVIISPVVSVLGWLGTMALLVVVSVQSTILVTAWARPEAVVEPERHVKHWLIVLLVEGAGLGSAAFFIDAGTGSGSTYFVHANPALAWLLYTVVGIVVAVWWGGSILRTAARIDRCAATGRWGRWARGLQVVARSCLKTFIVVLELVNFDDGPESTIALVDAIDDE